MQSTRRFRSAAVPGLLLVSLSAAYLGCSREDPEKQRRLQAEEATRRRRAETEPPSPAVLEQLRAAAQDYMTEHEKEVTVQGFSFTQLTPNLYLVGANTAETATGKTGVQQLSAERLRDARKDEDGNVEDHGDFLWVIDRVDAAKMDVLAQRHGIAGEVASVRERHRGDDSSWGHRSWLDDYLLWHFLFHRPSPMGFGYGSGFMPHPPGYRFYAPQRPFQDADARPYQGATGGGRSSVFLTGQAWNPPRATEVPITGQAYGVSAQHGGFTGKTGIGGIARGGFGAAGHGAAAGS